MAYICRHGNQCFSTLINGPDLYYAGIILPMAKISGGNDLGHALCQNLRDGDWLIDYIVSRLRTYPRLDKVITFLLTSVDGI